MAYFGKEFKLEKQEDFEKFVNALPAIVPEEFKKAAIANKPSTKLVKNGDTYTLYSIRPDKVYEVSFKDGVEFDETVREGLVAKTKFTVSGDTYTQVQIFPVGTLTIKREYSDNQLVVTISRSGYDGVARRYFKA